MNVDYLFYILIGVGVLSILSTFFDSKWIISKLFSKKKISVDTKTSESKESDFLHVISLWYQLKEQCEKCNLTVASDKLDEVFPLLNGILNDDQDN